MKRRLGDNIIRERQRAERERGIELSYRDIAKASGASYWDVTRWVTGVTMPTPRALKSLAAALGCEVESLTDGTGYGETEERLFMCLLELAEEEKIDTSGRHNETKG